MMFKAPTFWHQRSSRIALILWPLSILYTLVTRWLRFRQSPVKISSFVLSVGNLVMGGAGKTPVALMLAEIFQHQGKNVYFITRGYGGRLTGPCQVLSNHGYCDVGDESLILAQVAPTWISRNRALAAQAAQQAGANFLILDDGHQHMSLIKDLSLLVIDTDYGYGNGHVFPAGPLRESVAQGYRRADGVILVGKRPFSFFCAQPCLRVDFLPNQQDLKALQGQSLIAFCGIGRPSKFFKMLESQQKVHQFNLLEKIDYADHHRYTEKDVADLYTKADQRNAILVTTEKDFMRWPCSKKIQVVRIKAQILEGDWDHFWTQMTTKVKGHECTK